MQSLAPAAVSPCRSRGRAGAVCSSREGEHLSHAPPAAMATWHEEVDEDVRARRGHPQRSVCRWGGTGPRLRRRGATASRQANPPARNRRPSRCPAEGIHGRTLGLPWLDEPGTDVGMVRFSRAAGLPAPAPDVLGFALRLQALGTQHDLLLASTGMRPGWRHVLFPRRHALRGRCCIVRSRGRRDCLIRVGQIARASSSKAARTRRFTTSSVPSS
jgi:hypothetical protein